MGKGRQGYILDASASYYVLPCYHNPSIKAFSKYMEFDDRKTVHDNVRLYGGYKDEPIEVTEWINGEGWDICLDEQLIRLHFSELEAINYLIKSLEFRNNEGNR